MDEVPATTTTPQWKSAALPSTVWAAAAVLVFDLSGSAYSLEGSYMSLVFAAGMLFLAALLVGRMYGAAHGFNILWMGLGIAVDTFVAAMIAEEFLGVSRNLWPFTIVVYWTVGTLPVTIGVLSGAFWRARSVKR